MSTESTDRRIALVTGASRGIGRAIAESLADGLFVIINYQSNEAAAQETLAAIGGSQHGQLMQFDVSNEAAVEAAIKTISEQHKRLDVLVNNAAVAIDGLLMRVKTADWHRVLETNLSSAFYLCRGASRLLLKAKRERAHHQPDLGRGRVRQCGTGKLCECQSWPDWINPLARQGVCLAWGYSQRCFPRLYRDGHDEAAPGWRCAPAADFSDPTGAGWSAAGHCCCSGIRPPQPPATSQGRSCA